MNSERRTPLIKKLLLLIALSFVIGCAGMTIAIKDAYDQDVEIKKAKLKHASALDVISGGNEYKVALKDVSEIIIYANNTDAPVKTHKGRLYFQALLRFKDQSQLRFKGANDGATYLCIEDTLVGLSHGNKVQVKLSDVQTLKIP